MVSKVRLRSRGQKRGGKDKGGSGHQQWGEIIPENGIPMMKNTGVQYLI